MAPDGLGATAVVRANHWRVFSRFVRDGLLVTLVLYSALRDGSLVPYEMALLAMAAVLFIAADGRWLSRYLQGELWLSISPLGIQTGWAPLRPWSSLRDVRLERRLLSVNPGWNASGWVLQYRLGGDDRPTAIDLGWFGRPGAVRDQLRQLLLPAA